MSPLPGFFVTGTDTGAGKTWVAQGLIAALRRRGHAAIGMKPVASGCLRTPQGLRNADALALQRASSVAVGYGSVNPYAFEPAIAPHIAAREAGVEIAFGRIRALACELAGRCDYLVVEGVGGWRVPLGAEGDVAVLAATLGLPVVLVVGVRLGCLNHAFLTARAIVADGLTLAGWVGNVVEPGMERPAENLEALREGIGAPCAGLVPHLARCEPARLAAWLDLEPLLGAVPIAEAIVDR